MFNWFRGNSRKGTAAQRNSSEAISKELAAPRPENKPSEDGGNRVSVTSTPPQLPQQVIMMLLFYL